MRECFFLLHSFSNIQGVSMSLSRFLFSSVVFVSFSSAAFAQISIPTPALSKTEVQAIIKETLINEPEIIMQALEKLRAKKAEDSKKDALVGIEKNKDLLTKNIDSPSIGPADADITLVEFYDYHCGYCKHFLPVITEYMKEDKKIRVVFKELPILSEDSVTAARAAIAVNRIAKAKFFEFHTALMTEKGKFDEPRLLEIAKKIGIDSNKLKAEMAKPEITAILDGNRKLADELGIRGTPAIILGNNLIPGAMDITELKKQVAEARAKK